MSRDDPVANSLRIRMRTFCLCQGIGIMKEIVTCSGYPGQRLVPFMRDETARYALSSNEEVSAAL